MPGHTDKITKKNAVHGAVLAGFLGWTLDSFDFFVVVFLIDSLAHRVHRVSAAVRANVAVIYNLGAVVGAIAFGHFSQKIGWRKSIYHGVGIIVGGHPLVGFGGNLPALIVGAILMQTGVGGACGVIPVHLNELSADAARGLKPGLAYQLGISFASPTNSMQYALRARVGYPWAIAGFEMATIVTLAVIVWSGREAHIDVAIRTVDLLDQLISIVQGRYMSLHGEDLHSHRSDDGSNCVTYVAIPDDPESVAGNRHNIERFPHEGSLICESCGASLSQNTGLRPIQTHLVKR